MIENGTNTVKLVGFGYSCPVSNVKSDSVGTNMMTECLGSSAYLAPEMLAQRPYDARETDLFALGVILYTMVTN